ncbi:unnamed protein product [Nesidiocoris tenuis]|uniref:Uncharacterized protein n=1 Tax=Nesidiocoris tenuis TaxID=355587 RepID=A0A6H5HR04_9HEMI|nr:unnamed protein product [Nesidiocoris tenuis]
MGAADTDRMTSRGHSRPINGRKPLDQIRSHFRARQSTAKERPKSADADWPPTPFRAILARGFCADEANFWAEIVTENSSTECPRAVCNLPARSDWKDSKQRGTEVNEAELSLRALLLWRLKNKMETSRNTCVGTASSDSGYAIFHQLKTVLPNRFLPYTQKQPKKKIYIVEILDFFLENSS